MKKEHTTHSRQKNDRATNGNIEDHPLCMCRGLASSDDSTDESQQDATASSTSYTDADIESNERNDTLPPSIYDPYSGIANNEFHPDDQTPPDTLSQHSLYGD